MPEPVELRYTYLTVDNNGEAVILREAPGQDQAQAMFDDDVWVFRFLSFSDAAKQMSGKEGRIEKMQVSEKDDAEEGDDDLYVIDWEEVR
jgi:hypothetical protein